MMGSRKALHYDGARGVGCKSPSTGSTGRQGFTDGETEKQESGEMLLVGRKKQKQEPSMKSCGRQAWKGKEQVSTRVSNPRRPFCSRENHYAVLLERRKDIRPTDEHCVCASDIINSADDPVTDPNNT